MDVHLIPRILNEHAEMIQTEALLNSDEFKIPSIQ